MSHRVKLLVHLKTPVEQLGDKQKQIIGYGQNWWVLGLGMESIQNLTWALIAKIIKQILVYR